MLVIVDFDFAYVQKFYDLLNLTFHLIMLKVDLKEQLQTVISLLVVNFDR